MQPRGARAKRSVDEQVAGQSTGAGAVDEVVRRLGRGHRLAPVADDLDAVVGVADLGPFVDAADVGACAFVHRGDTERGRGVEGGQPRLTALPGCQPVACGRAHQVVCVAGQWLLGRETRGFRQTWRQSAQRGRGRRGVHIDAGKVGGPVADDTIEVIGAGRGVLGPAGFVPAVSPDWPVRMRAHVIGDERQAVPQ